MNPILVFILWCFGGLLLTVGICYYGPKMGRWMMDKMKWWL